jgi:SIR2-like domain
LIFDRTDRRTVLLLGAGATRGALPHSLLNGKRLKPPLNGDFFQVAATYARAHGPHSVETRRLGRLRRVFRDDIPVRGLPTMEEAFSLLSLAGDSPEIYKRRRGRRPAADQRQEIDDFLRLAFGILTQLDRSNGAPTGYDRLAAKLGPGDTVVTLNYDTLLDSALWRHGWDPKRGYGLKGGVNKMQWQAARAVSSSSASSVRLLKLHGSVNWFVRGAVSHLEDLFTKKPVRVTAPRRNEIANHIRQTIPPVYGKAFKHDHWRTLWDLAYHALREADVLVIIGCSLVDTDFHLRALFSRVAKWRKKEGLLFRSVL